MSDEKGEAAGRRSLRSVVPLEQVARSSLGLVGSNLGIQEQFTHVQKRGPRVRQALIPRETGFKAS